ncbi:MAG: ABC transporter ATP-binding protein [Desulfobacteraceae bacterium]|nr:MAG: ABC transporter ATP-binding protein [Desulfobacteraceae bacterium]
MLRVETIDVFYGDLQALHQAGFEVRPGEIVAVIGSNGSGKSTCLKAISGLLRPKHGHIYFNEQDLRTVSTSGIVEMGLSHVPEGRQLFPNMTVMENLEMGAQFAEMKRKRRETLEEVFELFPRLRERTGQSAGTLSGGEQQMLAIGRGLMSRPKLLMLDEPSLGLAPLLVSTIFKTIEDVNRKGMMILLVEQNVFHALKLCKRGYALENGAVSISGTGEELIKNEHIRRTYLGL